MELTSLYFLILSVISIQIYYLLNHKYKLAFLSFLGCCFIATFSYLLLIYVLVYSLINYWFGIQIHSSQRLKRLIFRLAIVFNLLQLIVLKYSSFAVDPVLQLFNYDFNASQISELIIPLGVSFFTLQSTGYLINIKMGWEKPERSFVNFFLLISFYPKFLSGPIERSNHFLPQLRQEKHFSEPEVIAGLRMVVLGVFKKVAIANQLAPIIENTYANGGIIGGQPTWFVFLIQPLYLYFDFSGYTDIAIGLARAFGFKLAPNFNKPFLSENVTAFWKSFHISLSSWFNDYIFRQTSFKLRKWGIYASIMGVLITWTLFGIWHGAGWNYMLLGFLQALAIIYEFFTKKARVRLFSRVPAFVRTWVGRIITYLFYAFSLIFFFSQDKNTLLSFFSSLFTDSGYVFTEVRIELLFLSFFFIAIFLLLEILEADLYSVFNRINIVWISNSLIIKCLRWLIYLVLFTVIIVLSNNIQQFIYFQF